MYRLVFQNNLFIVIYKLPNVNFHKEDDDDSLFEALRRDLTIEKLFPVHRLDKMTSGLLVIAKSSKVAAQLTKLFEERAVNKTYIALSNKKPKKKQGTISGDMERSRRKSWKLVRTKNNPAVTTFKSIALEDGVRLYVCKPLSGKTHQIRVALKSIGAPILGDPIYSPDAEQFDRGYLHAFQLSFELEGETYSFCELPMEGTLFNSEKCREVLRQFDVQK